MAEDVQDIQKMLVDYAKQETVTPLKALGRYLGFGIAGSIFVALGVFFWSLGILRFSQSIDQFEGASWGSTVPYFITTLSLVFFMVVLYSTLVRAKKKVS